MLTVTYQELLGEYPAEGFIQDIETVTGPKEIYGLTNPISLLAILDGCGLETCLTCLDAVTANTLPFVLSVGTEWIREHLYPYHEVLPNDDRPFDLMAYIDFYQSAGNVTTERLDYCGRSLGGASQVTIAQITDLANNILITVNTLDISREPTTYSMVIQTNGEYTPEQLADLMDGTRIVGINPEPIRHPAWLTPTGIAGTYIPQPIAASLASNPDYYLNMPVEYDPDISLFYAIQYQNNVGTDQVDLVKIGAQGIGRAAALVAQILIEANPYLCSTLMQLIRSGVTTYNDGKRIQLLPRRTRTKQFSRGLPPIHTGNSEFDELGQTVEDAGSNARASRLRDLAYLSSHDVDGTGRLSEAERIQAEVDLQLPMQAAMADVGQTLYNQTVAEFESFLGVTDNLQSIFRTYLLAT